MGGQSCFLLPWPPPCPPTPPPALLSFPRHRHSIQPPRVKPLLSPSYSHPGAAWQALPTAALCRVLAITWALPAAWAPSWPGAWLRRGPGIRGLLPLQLQHFCRVLSLWVVPCLPCC